MVSPRATLSLFCFTITVFLGVAASSPLQEEYILGKHYIDAINSVAKTWKAGENFGPKTTLKYIIGLLGSKGVRKNLFNNRDELFTADSLPEEFDARKVWTNCTTIGMVHDQANCGCCWAFSTTEAFSDRLCIATDGKFNEILSVEELSFCCRGCGFGCDGGYPIRAWRYFNYHGVVTGGDYGSNEGCQPYRVKPCDANNTCEETEKNHKCSKECYGNKTINFKANHKLTGSAYELAYDSIMYDILTYGPAEASLNVYDDFIHYKSGVYQKTENASYLGGHSVKCIGWGVEDDTPYWLMVNSWKEAWGDNGLFKIRRGTNECDVDNSFTGGIPK